MGGNYPHQILAHRYVEGVIEYAVDDAAGLFPNYF
jgi:hypothetical protein